MKFANHFLESKARRNFPAKWNWEFEKEELKKRVEKVRGRDRLKLINRNEFHRGKGLFVWYVPKDAFFIWTVAF